MSQISLFDDRSDKQSDKVIAKKTKEKTKKNAVVVKSNGILSKINIIRKFVEENHSVDGVVRQYKQLFSTLTGRDHE